MDITLRNLLKAKILTLTAYSHYQADYNNYVICQPRPFTQPQLYALLFNNSPVVLELGIEKFLDAYAQHYNDHRHFPTYFKIAYRYHSPLLTAAMRSYPLPTHFTEGGKELYTKLSELQFSLTQDTLVLRDYKVIYTSTGYHLYYMEAPLSGNIQDVDEFYTTLLGRYPGSTLFKWTYNKGQNLQEQESIVTKEWPAADRPLEEQIEWHIIDLLTRLLYQHKDEILDVLEAKFQGFKREELEEYIHILLKKILY